MRWFSKQTQFLNWVHHPIICNLIFFKCVFLAGKLPFFFITCFLHLYKSIRLFLWNVHCGNFNKLSYLIFYCRTIFLYSKYGIKQVAQIRQCCSTVVIVSCLSSGNEKFASYFFKYVQCINWIVGLFGLSLAAVPVIAGYQK